MGKVDKILDWNDLNDPSICHKGFNTIGSVRIPNMIKPSMVEDIFSGAERLFNLTEDEKLACRSSGMSSGYTPPGIEGVKNQNKDIDRCFWDILSPDREINIFPKQEKLFQEQVANLYRILEDVIIRALASAYPEVSTRAVAGRHMLRFSYYQPNSAGQIIFPSHVDFGIITAYLGGSGPGLQGKINGQWMEVVNPIGSVILGAGTTLRMYDKKVIPFPHRVFGTPATRISAVFFSEPRLEVVLPNGLTAGEHLRRLVEEIRRK